jgi:hypothetical protein
MFKILPSFYRSCLENQLQLAQLLQLEILVWMLQTFKEVRLERLAALMPKPIKYESRRRAIQRFLVLPIVSVPALWFPIVKYLLRRQQRLFEAKYKSAKRRRIAKRKLKNYFFVAIDRTQWRDKNLFVVSVIWEKRAWPVAWVLLDKKGSSNLREQQQLLRPVLRLLKGYQFVVIGDREFSSVGLACWLRQQDVKFVFRIKQSTHIYLPAFNYQPLRELGLTPGTSLFLRSVEVTHQSGYGTFNLAAYWQRGYRKHHQTEGWYLLTNLPCLTSAVTAYKARFGIEAMFKDCKSGGYNLEGSHANEARLLALVLLIALAYTCATFLGRTLKNAGVQHYIARLTELTRTQRRHSSFWVGLYGTVWVAGLEFFADLAECFRRVSPHKLPYFQKGLRVMALIQSSV